jgi:hypothetical protein
MKTISISIFIIFIFFIACNSEDKNIINQQKMEDLMVDIHLAETYVQYMRNDSIKINIEDSLKKQMAIILGKHKTTQAEFKQSMAWYNEHPALLDSVYTHVLTKLSILQYANADTDTILPTSPLPIR